MSNVNIWPPERGERKGAAYIARSLNLPKNLPFILVSFCPTLKTLRNVKLLDSLEKVKAKGSNLGWQRKTW